jgi:hypothetical protein
MAQTDIYVGVKDNSTTTTAFPVKKGDHITFHNRGPDVLTVTFTDTPLCINKVGQGTVTVPVGGVSSKLDVCKGPKDGGYPFTNEITGFAAEDPIVIIESDNFGSIFSLLKDPIVIIEAVLVVVALAAGYALGRRHAARKAPASAGRP